MVGGGRVVNGVWSATCNGGSNCCDMLLPKTRQMKGHSKRACYIQPGQPSI
ncbi:unnamed protein product [Ectocarpus sp. 6 AP-2014]